MYVYVYGGGGGARSGDCLMYVTYILYKLLVTCSAVCLYLLGYESEFACFNTNTFNHADIDQYLNVLDSTSYSRVA